MRADLVGHSVGASENRQHAGRFQRGGSVDLVDRRMGVRRAKKIGVSLAGAVDVVCVAALAGDEADIFLALDRGANAGRAHETLPGAADLAPSGRSADQMDRPASLRGPDLAKIWIYSAALAAPADAISRAPWATDLTIL